MSNTCLFIVVVTFNINCHFFMHLMFCLLRSSWWEGWAHSLFASCLAHQTVLQPESSPQWRFVVFLVNETELSIWRSGNSGLNVVPGKHRLCLIFDNIGYLWYKCTVDDRATRFCSPCCYLWHEDSQHLILADHSFPCRWRTRCCRKLSFSSSSWEFRYFS